MNIDSLPQLRECTSCQMCGAVCPVGAITIKLNDEGFYRPFVDIEKCIDCGLCVKNCYKFDESIRMTRILDDKKLYSAWAKNEQIVKSTTSGGIAYLLADRLIRLGYKCIGIEYDSDSNCAVAKTASTLDGIQSFRGSKYIQALTVHSFRELVKNCKKEKYAVFGLPCQIYAIDRFLRAKGVRENHLLIDLYCHGCPSLNLWKKYIDDVLVKTDCQRVVSSNFRSKIRGWGNFYVAEIVVKGTKGQKKYVSQRINDPFYTMFFSDRILNDSCYKCKLRSTLEYTDIRLGDFWGNKFLNNRKGVSGVTICSDNGAILFNELKQSIEFKEQTFSSFLPFQSYGKEYEMNVQSRKELLSELANPKTSLRNVVRTYKTSLPFKKRLVLEVKNIIKLMPQNLVSGLKAFAYSSNK